MDKVEYTGELPPELEEVRKWCKKALESKEVDDFLWRHTESVHHYEAIIDALRYLANMSFVEWR